MTLASNPLKSHVQREATPAPLLASSMSPALVLSHAKTPCLAAQRVVVALMNRDSIADIDQVFPPPNRKLLLLFHRAERRRQPFRLLRKRVVPSRYNTHRRVDKICHGRTLSNGSSHYWQPDRKGGDDAPSISAQPECTHERV